MASSIARGLESPVLDITLGDMVAGMAACFPERDALISRHQNVCLSWSELDQEVDRTARGLAGLGLEPFDRVGVWSANCAEWVILQLACARAGFILVSINPSYRAHELASVLRKSHVKALLLWDHDARCNYARILEEATRAQNLPLKHIVWMGTNSWMRMLTNAKNLSERAQLSTDTVNIHYTAGTTGEPKGVLLTHRNLINNAWQVSARLGITEEDRICNPCPLFHYTGSMINTLTALVRGAALILPSPQFDPRSVLQAIQDERATVVGGPAAMYVAQLDYLAFEDFDTSSLRVAWMGGTPCSPEVWRRAKEKMRVGYLSVLYTQTESAPVIAMTASDDVDGPAGMQVGQMLPNVEVKIISRITGQAVPLGSPGELCVRGCMVARELDGATDQEIDSEGWLHTGDMAMLQQDGRLQIAGRVVTDSRRPKPVAREERPATVAATSAR
jgi:fatty-acyl-CoA synthase